MKGKIITESARLIVREFTAYDTAFIVELLNSEGWLKYIGDRHVRTEADALRYLENVPLKQYATLSFGLWKVELKETGQDIGMCGLLKRDNLELPDIGFAFLPQFGGAGFAFESAKACLEFAASKGFNEVCAITLPENKSSIRLLEKIGMHFDREILMPPGDELLQVFVGRTR